MIIQPMRRGLELDPLIGSESVACYHVQSNIILNVYVPWQAHETNVISNIFIWNIFLSCTSSDVKTLASRRWLKEGGRRMLRETVVVQSTPTLQMQWRFEDNNSNFINLKNFCQGMEDTVWRVGCYNINPTTPNGQKFFILHMLVLPLIPITALVIQV